VAHGSIGAEAPPPPRAVDQNNGMTFLSHPMV